MSLLEVPGCVSFEHIVLFNENIMNIFNRKFSLILLIIGIIGNGLGLYFETLATNWYHTRQRYSNNTTKPRINDLPIRGKGKGRGSKSWFNKYLLAWFFGINLLNSVLMIPSPIMELYGDDNVDLRWKSWIWINYIAHVHYPLTKTLICFGFLIYVIYFANQMIAVLRPYDYRRLITIGHINSVLVFCLIYASVWFVPIYRWFSVIKFNLCPGPDGTWSRFRNVNHVTLVVTNGTTPVSSSIIVYTYRATAYTWSEGRSWHLYQLFRELFVLIFPFTAVLLSKFLVFRNSRSTVRRLTEISLAHRPSVGWLKGAVKSKPPKCNGVTEHRSETRLDRKSGESLQHMRTFVVLTVEFFVLLLPVSINQSLMNWWPSRFNHPTLAMVYMIMLLQQAIYISSTFFINFTFNKYYRSYVTDVLRSQRVFNKLLQ